MSLINIIICCNNTIKRDQVAKYNEPLHIRNHTLYIKVYRYPTCTCT